MINSETSWSVPRISNHRTNSAFHWMKIVIFNLKLGKQVGKPKFWNLQICLDIRWFKPWHNFIPYLEVTGTQPSKGSQKLGVNQTIPKSVTSRICIAHHLPKCSMYGIFTKPFPLVHVAIFRIHQVETHFSLTKCFWIMEIYGYLFPPPYATFAPQEIAGLIKA